MVSILSDWFVLLEKDAVFSGMPIPELAEGPDLDLDAGAGRVNRNHPQSHTGASPVVRPATMVGNRYDRKSFAIDLKNDAIREPLHAGLSMNCIQPAEPVGFM